MTTVHLDTSRHPIATGTYVSDCRRRLDEDGALVLQGFLTPKAVALIVAEAAHRESEAFFATETHNVYLTAPNPDLPANHPYNRQVVSSKGLIADDQIDAGSPLRKIYDDSPFRTFLCRVLGITEIHPYADRLSSINVHFTSEARELGWHFDNSSFAVTVLIQAPTDGAHFEYVPAVRDADRGQMAYDRVASVLEGNETVRTLHFEPGDLVLFRGRNALHRVTPTRGPVTRILVVFAFNDRPGIGLSDSALQTFYGRTN